MIQLIIVVLAWGFSWYAIRLQVGDVAPIVSVGWRFLIAGLLLLAWLLIRGKFQLPLQQYRVKLVFLGTFLFGANFISFYYAAPHLPSGLISIVFAMAVFVVSLNEWVWRRKKPEAKTIVGALFGVTGLALLFGPSILFEQNLSNQGQSSITGVATPLLGLALSILGTWFFSVGNLISQSIPREVHMPSAISCSMLFSAITCLAIGYLFGNSLSLPVNTLYLASLAYLSIGASVIAFICYLSLVRNKGAAKASYATVLFPIIALAVSTAVEGYQWTPSTALGAVLSLIGAYIVFRPDKT